jgi:peptide/nickel transport system substrate-binding protein
VGCSQASARRALAATAIALAASAGCRDATRSASPFPNPITMTMGVGQLSTSKQEFGLPKVANNIALETLAKVGHDGRSTPWLAESWYTAPDGRSLRIRLRPHVTFHDGSAVTAAVVAQIVQEQLPRALGPAFSQITGVRVVSDNEIEISQKRTSPFLPESLDILIEKPGAKGVGTGPFSLSAGPDGMEMQANHAYYLGRPTIERIVMRSYPTVRSAWADMLRGQVDMLYEVGLDALDSLQASSRVSVYTFPRPYAYAIVLNIRRPLFRAAEVRRALNQAVDRGQLIREALYNHGTPADGPVWPHHWAYNTTFPAFQHDPLAASQALKGRPHFTCIFPEGALFERLALAVQQQLATVGVDMQIKAVPLDELVTRVRESHDFDAALFDAQLGPNLFRPYQWWHSDGPSNVGGFSSRKVDAALDTIRYAVNDAEYAAGVLDFQRAIIDDPPAVFLAWGERVRAVSRRFEIPVERDRDVLTSLRLWKPAADQRAANRN